MDDERSGADAPGIARRSWPRPLLGTRADRITTVCQVEFAEFYRGEVGRVVGFLMKIGATEHEAADAAQAAFTHAWTTWDAIHTNPRGWVRTVAMREFYRQIPTHEFPSATMPDRPTLLSPGAVVDISERTRAAQELLAGLPTTQRHIMAWTADGFSTAEIARLTGKTEAAVRKNLQRARDTLKRRLAEGQGGAQ